MSELVEEKLTQKHNLQNQNLAQNETVHRLQNNYVLPIIFCIEQFKIQFFFLNFCSVFSLIVYKKTSSLPFSVLKYIALNYLH